MGRYFSLCLFKEKRPKRLYYAVQCFSELNQKQTKAILHYYDKISSNNEEFDPDLAPIENEEELTPYIHFAIKNNKSLTNKLLDQGKTKTQNTNIKKEAQQNLAP